MNRSAQSAKIDPVPLHPQAKLLLEAIAAMGDPPLAEDTPTAARERRAARLRPSNVHLEDISDLDAAGVPCRLYRPSADTTLALVIYFHGGGWVIGDLDTHDGLCRALAAESRAAVLSVAYRLAPEHPFPAALHDVVAATGWIAAHAADLGCDPQRVAIAGDSAGAGLATVVAQLGLVPLRYQLLIYPVTDARCTSASYDEFLDGPGLTRAGMEWFIGHYLSGGGSADDPRVSPLLAGDQALANVPPGLIITAELDPLRDEGEAYAARLNAAGVATSLIRYGGMYHGFMSVAADLLTDSGLAHAVAGRALARALAD